MLDISYRLYLDGTSFTREQLDRVETIVVSQEMDGRRRSARTPFSTSKASGNMAMARSSLR
jgi:hypothetical protein